MLYGHTGYICWLEANYTGGAVRAAKGIVLLTALVLQACATTGGDGASEAPAEAVVTPTYVPQQGLSDKERFREVLALLEDGDPLAARAELLLYLQAQPNSEIGRDLLAQIDEPSAEYFPEEYREVQLQSGQSLSTLSQQYLGSVFRFHALAKYNGIAEPRKLSAGQTIRIPLTTQAREAFAAADSGTPVATPAPASRPAPAPEPAPAAAEAPVEPPAPVKAPPPPPGPAAEETTAEQVEQLHREALNAYRAQDLDRAIALWDEVLALDPGHENARLYRSQAMDMKKKLENMI